MHGPNQCHLIAAKLHCGTKLQTGNHTLFESVDLRLVKAVQHAYTIA